MQDGSDIVNFSHYFIFQVMELHVHEVLLCRHLFDFTQGIVYNLLEYYR